jgi:hypothetical protein
MTSFVNQYPNNTFGDILTTTNSGQGLTTTLQPLQDALGNNSTVTIAKNAINFNRMGGNVFQLDGSPLTASASILNNIAGGPAATGFFVSSGVLTATQIQNMHVTPVAIIPAPGAGLAIVVRELVLNYVFGTVAYADGGEIALYYAGTQLAFNPVAGTSLAGLTANSLCSAYNSFTLDMFNSNTAINQPVTIQSTVPYITGDGILKYAAWYTVMQVQ